MISKLHLHNFKCFEDQGFGVGPLTVLSGLNGMGKSTVLQAMLLLRQSFEQGLLQKTGLALNGEYVKVGTAKDALFEDAADDSLALTLGYGDQLEAKWSFSYDAAADVMGRTSGTGEEGVFAEPLFGTGFHYLEAERTGPRILFETSDYYVRRLRKIGTKGEYAAHFLTLFGGEPVAVSQLLHPCGESDRLKDQVEAWLGEISPGTRLHDTSHRTLDIVSLEYSFAHGKKVSNNYRATNVGFGITYVLPLLVAILSSKPGSLVLLENPEAHLHPRGQLRIGELVSLAAGGGVQTIVETHSDHILNGIRLAVHGGKLAAGKAILHFFQRGTCEGVCPSQVISPRIDRNGRLDCWPEGFFDEADRALDRLMGPSAG
jgi:predicted ATPase